MKHITKLSALTVFGVVFVGVAVCPAADVTIFAELGGDVTAWDQPISAGQQFYVKLTSTYPLDQVYGYMIEINYDKNLLMAVDNNPGIDNESQWIGGGSPVDVSFSGDNYGTHLDGEPVLVATDGKVIVSVAVTLPAAAQPTYPWHHTIAQVAFIAVQAIATATPINFALNAQRGGVVGTGPQAVSVEFVKSCGLTADLDHNGTVNWGDFAVFAGQWLAGGRGLSADLNYSEAVNWGDFAVFAGQWLASCP